MLQHDQRELDFVISLFQKLRIPARMIRPEEPLKTLDGGLRQILGVAYADPNVFYMASRRRRQHTAYKIQDRFFCHYIALLLPGASGGTPLVIGPYLTEALTRETVGELAQTMKLPPQRIPQLISHYMAMPVCRDTDSLMAVITTLGESLWGVRDFHVVDVNDEQQIPLWEQDALIEQETILWQKEQMEARYAFENELMEIVSKGQTSRISNIASGLSALSFEQRHADPLRSMKNYCIVCNTLLRKAAQQGGVHPIHLDKISGRYAQMIEGIPTQNGCVDLIGKMIREYCYLVRNSGGTQYSALIEKTILYIEANLSADLSLTALAQQMRVSTSYLSTRFHKETKHTLAEYITDLRMKTALQLLKSTHLQIQAVAQLCGFSDPNYFGKQFKRFYGVTPLQYRKG